jgi:ADP-dependent NAD(P)H-hydrate dehydratase
MNIRNDHLIEKIDADWLKHWPLPALDGDGDKEMRGRVLIVAGTSENPGAALLAANAAFRAGAGKVTIATAESVATAIALHIPEARVIALPEGHAGSLASHAEAELVAVRDAFDAVLIGPGLMDQYSSCELASALVTKLGATKIILDAAAMGAAADIQNDAQPLLITPHAGEMAHLCAVDKQCVIDENHQMARELARKWRINVALKGRVTVICTPEGRLLEHEGGNVGLAVSGSGDILAGIIAALAARGASLEQAAAWGVVTHARAGVLLAERYGPIGYLPREICAEIPALLHALS